MRFASSITEATQLDRAVEELLAPIDTRLTPGMVDLGLLFCTAHFEDDLDEIVERLSAVLPGAVLLGCTAEGTIGFDKELERTPSITLLVASLPDVTIRPFYLQQDDLTSIETLPDWERLVGVSPESEPAFIALGDPFAFAIHDFVDKLSDAFPGAPLVGGVASAASEPKQNRLLLDGNVYREGLVGVALSGNLTMDTVVSQGCRPIGTPFVITKAERNVIHELGAKPALLQLHEAYVGLSEEDEKLARNSLLIGRVIDEYKSDFVRGDFLIHNIIGVDRQSGAIAMAAHARVGATVQFHVRDAATASEDLRNMLSNYQARSVRGALLFGCNGRGSHMWDEAGHDAHMIQQLLGDVPVAGLFCGGEFGPVGGRNFVHGFTASIALFRDRN